MLTTVESIRQYLGKDDSDTGDDDLLFELVKRISTAINNGLNRIIEAADYTEYYQGDGTNKLLVRQFPINSVTAIYDDVDRQWGASNQKDSANIIISQQCPGLIQLKSDIFINSQLWSYYNLENIKIIYNAGYATIPYDIEQAANKLVSVEYFKSKGMMAGIKSDRNPDALMSEAWDVLNQYKKIR